MSKIMYILGLILLCLFASANCDEIDCAKIPIENLEPCKMFLSNNSTNKPSEKCCEGASSWIAAPFEVVCICYKKSPNRLSFKPDEIKAAALPYECKESEFYKYVHCLL
ncbi:hypothetical protein PHJA_001970000 [Phtheirospermum japonicum]|uniref:Bifunctional inhibitor/plant lipid transfer protein/seed storage helical domain-containing protein n=1 Tax=Phtheirospermum japonicum TaxID=374723 RepID=A0A830CVB7_9LAMI|nr:hypothetical protein PHJA_001970000 [Phtheirospermum japonicum]